MSRRYLAITPLLSGACAIQPIVPATSIQPTVPVTSLADSQLHVAVEHWSTSPNQFSLDISKAGADPAVNAAKVSDCVALSSSTMITANGTPGVMTSGGGFDDGDDGFETNCSDPGFQVELAAPPPTVAIVLDDGTADVEIDLAMGSGGKYAVTSCGAVTCEIDQSP